MLSGGPVIFDINPYEQTDQQEHQLGAKGVDQFGDVYRYTKILSTATDLVAGKLYVALATEDNHVNQTLGAAAAVGATSIELGVGGTQVDANEYDWGKLCFVDTSPEGETYRVVSHDASASGSENVTVNLERTLLTAATTSSEASLIRNPWNNPSANQNIAEEAAGVALVDWDVSVGNFGWLLTRGVAAVLGDTGGVSDGSEVCISNQVNGAVGARTSVTERSIGVALDASAADEYHPVALYID